MYQSPVALGPETIQDSVSLRRPDVERIAGWSSRYRENSGLRLAPSPAEVVVTGPDATGRG